MRHFDPVTLRLFVAVCEERNIAVAARREAIVPSAVSKRIALMEEETGARLLERGRRGVTATPAGEVLYRYAKEILGLVGRMHAEVSAFAQGVQGHVRVFATISAVAQFLPDDVSVFASRYDKVRVSFEEREIWEVVRGVEEGRADIGVCWDAVALGRLRAYPYRHDRLAAVVHPSHPLAARARVAFEDTIDYEHVDVVGRSIMRAMQQGHATAAGKRMRYRIEVSTVDAACRIAAANLALAIVPEDEAKVLEAQLGLRVLPLTNPWARRRFVVAVRDERALSVPAALLLQSLRERSARVSRRAAAAGSAG